MKYLVISMTLLTACCPVAKKTCTVKSTPSGAVISCLDGTKETVTNGTNGHSGALKQVVADSSICTNGGYVISMGTDLNDNAFLDDSEISSAFKVCNGIDGSVGGVGSSGLDGIGIAGLNGSSCTTSTTSTGAIITCSDGTSSIISNGSQGNQGPPGLQGNPGHSNASAVTPVKFCSQYTTVYPTTFPEYGLKIGNSIYAVYYDTHNAWMALIVPGTYMSTSSSAPCNFTVNTDGSISN